MADVHALDSALRAASLGLGARADSDPHPYAQSMPGPHAHAVLGGAHFPPPPPALACDSRCSSMASMLPTSPAGLNGAQAPPFPGSLAGSPTPAAQAPAMALPRGCPSASSPGQASTDAGHGMAGTRMVPASLQGIAPLPVFAGDSERSPIWPDMLPVVEEHIDPKGMGADVRGPGTGDGVRAASVLELSGVAEVSADVPASHEDPYAASSGALDIAASTAPSSVHHSLAYIEDSTLGFLPL